jgi:hypothetical protein
MTTEIERLRAKQAARAMKKVSPLLDAWEQLPNDVKSESELKHVRKCMEALFRAVEDDRE